MYDAAMAERSERHFAAERRSHFLDDIWSAATEPRIAVRIGILAAVVGYGAYLVSDINTPAKTPSQTCTASSIPACKP